MVCCYCNFFIVLLYDYLFINHLDVRVIRGLAIINFYFILYDWLFIIFLCVTSVYVCVYVVSYHGSISFHPFVCVFVRVRMEDEATVSLFFCLFAYFSFLFNSPFSS